MTSYGQLTEQQIRRWMIYAETQEQADALNAKYKPALSRFWEAAKSPD